MLHPVALDDGLLRHGVGGHDRGRGVRAPVGGRSRRHRVHAVEQLLAVVHQPDPVEQTTTSMAPTPTRSAHPLGHRVRGLEALGVGSWNPVDRHARLDRQLRRDVDARAIERDRRAVAVVERRPSRTGRCPRHLPLLAHVVADAAGA